MVADKPEVVVRVDFAWSGALLTDNDKLEFLWVINFPLLSLIHGKSLCRVHHPTFHREDLSLLDMIR